LARKQHQKKTPVRQPERASHAAPVVAYNLRNVAVAVALAVLVAVIYTQVRTHQFIDFDDPAYVSKNEHVLGGLTWSNVVWAFTTTHASNWHPLTWISHMIDVQLFGVDAGAHLLVNAALHALNCILLFLFLQLATGAMWRSAMVAALFAVHPLHVESVAWISERKDTLSTAFFLLCLLSYTRYVKTRSLPAYITTVVMLLLGLMAKPMLVTTPFVLLILDYWPFVRMSRESLRKLLVEKIPFFGCIVPSIVMTLIAQHNAMSSVVSMSLLIRISVAMIAYVAYIGKTIWPSGLAILYPLSTSIQPSAAIASSILLIAVTACAIYFRRTMPWIFAGWAWFLGTLIPVIGILQVGRQSMADRYTYIPHIGLFVAVIWSAAFLVRRRPAMRVPAAVAAGVTIALLAATAHAQVRYWAGSIPLFAHALAVTSGSNKIARVNLGAALVDAGDYSGAEREYRAAIGYQDAEIVYKGLSLALIGQGRLNEANAAAHAAMKANPNSADALAILGSVALALGNTAEAQSAFSQSLKIKADPAVEARLDMSRGDFQEARGKFEQAVSVDGENATVRNDYAAVLARLGEDTEAREQYEDALRLNPNLYDARMNYGALLSRLGRNPEAAQQFQQAARLQPHSPEPHVYAALVNANGRQFGAAQREIEQAMAIDHDASNRLLVSAIRIPPRPAAIDEYLAFLRQQSGGR